MTIFKSLLFVGGHSANCSKDRCCHNSIGGVLNLLAERYETVYWPSGIATSKQAAHDCPLAENVKIIEIPFASTMVQFFRFRNQITAQYEGLVRQADHVVIRALTPIHNGVYKFCLQYEKKPLHWLVTNHVGLLKSHRRNHWLKDQAGIWYMTYLELLAKKGGRKTGGAFLCNGQELMDRMLGSDCEVTVSSTIRETDLYYREDTCHQYPIRICSVCYIRPEKGIQYLIEALPLLKTKHSVELYYIGGRDRYPDYQEKIDAIIKKYSLENKVFFLGHFDQKKLWDFMKSSDIFVLPSLSEGTPRVIVESRAFGLPTIATNVGGIPTSMQHNVNGILVPPKSPIEIAHAIDRIIEEPEFRKTLIRNGYEKAKNCTLDRFVDQIITILERLNQGEKT